MKCHWPHCRRTSEPSDHLCEHHRWYLRGLERYDERAYEAAIFALQDERISLTPLPHTLPCSTWKPNPKKY